MAQNLLNLHFRNRQIFKSAEELIQKSIPRN